jgi:hypothetical protein
MTDATTLKTKPTTELETLLAVIEGILQEREDSQLTPVNIGDSVSFDLRKNCSVTGIVLGKTEKRVKVQCSSIKVQCSSIEGVYQIATKNVVVESSAPVVADADNEEEE